MDVESCCRLRVGSIVWQTRTGTWALTVVCKATYRLLPVESPLAQKQEEINAEDTYWDDDEARSLSVASDLAPFKARADVLLVGHAFAPMGQPVRALSVRLCVGEVDKAIEVWCGRGFNQDGRLVEGPRFTKMPLRYERAAGGPETSNPVGIRFDAPPDMYGMTALPNLQPPGRYVGWRGDTFDPIGFGPIAPMWPGRADNLYRYAAGWSHQRWSEQPIPDDIDPAYFNVAPRDQQVPEIRPNERILLEGLHPEHSRLVTSLVEVRPRAVVERRGQGSEDVALRCDTLLIDTDRAICTLVWRGRVALRHPGETGRVVVTEQGAAAGQAARSGMKDASVPNAVSNAAYVSGGDNTEFSEVDGGEIVGDIESAGTLVPSPEQAASAARAPATPFVKNPDAGMLKTGRGPVAPPALVNAPRPVAQPPTIGPLAGATGGVAPTGGYPAARPSSVYSSPNTAAPALSTEEGITITVPTAPVKEPLPFRPVTSSGAPPDWRGALTNDTKIPAGSDEEDVTIQALNRPTPLDRSGQANVVEAPPRPPLALAAVGSPAVGAFSAGALSPDVPAWSIGSATVAKPPAEVDVARPPEAPLPPPMIGPLARVDMGSPAPTQEEGSPSSPSPPAGVPPDPALEMQRPSAAEFPIEKCAAITASIARRRDEEAQILGEHELDPKRWKAIQKHWTEAIRKETARGKRELLKRYDWAYVEQLEKERGPIQVSEYALLTIAAERGATDEVLARLTLPRGAVMRIERVWIEKMGRSAALREEMLKITDALRGS